MLTSFVICWHRDQFLCNKEMSKKSEKSMKIVYVEEENLHIFWTTWRILMKFSETMWLMIILKVTKKPGFLLSLKNAFFFFLEKPQEESNWTPSLFWVKTKQKLFVLLMGKWYVRLSKWDQNSEFSVSSNFSLARFLVNESWWFKISKCRQG